MASGRHRPLPSSARNPFDSSDDEEEVKRANPVIHSHDRHYSNPFDDEEDHGGVLPNRPVPALRTSHSKQPQTEAYAKNPFDDNGNEDTYDGTATRQSSASTLKAKLDQGSLFDEESRFHGDLSVQEGKSKTRSLPAKSSLKKMQKIKDAGASQASRMVEGGLQQAQRLKESSFSALKSNEGKGKPLVVAGNARNQLFEEDASRGGLEKGGLGMYDKGQGFSDERHGLYGSGQRAKSHYDDHQFQGDDLEQRSVQELEGYALQKSEDTTKSLQKSLKVAEEIQGNAAETLGHLQHQREQIKRTHEIVLDVDQNLTAGEKSLGSLGGILSRPWKPSKGPAITGPIDDPSDLHIRREGHHLEQRTALGLGAKRQTDGSLYGSGDFQAQTTQDKLEVERTKQDDTLSNLSNVMEHLKVMSMDMAAEVSRQNVALDYFQNDVSTLDERMKGANERASHLLRVRNTSSLFF